MISKISMWTQGIVIAVIVGTILQMVLPENKNKKYIKVIIGIYVLFCIIHQVVGTSINLDDYNLENYLQLNEKSNNKTASLDDNVNKLFKENMIKAIKKDLNKQNCDSNNISIEYDNQYNIISIKISNIFEYKENSNSVNKIEININNKPKVGISVSDKDNIISILAENYNVKKDNIEIN